MHMSADTVHIIPVTDGDRDIHREDAVLRDIALPLFMRKYLRRAIFLSLTLLLSAFFVAQNANAQTSDNGAGMDIAAENLDINVFEEEEPLEVAQDENVQNADLGVDNVGVLPNQRFRYFFKKARRSLEETFTFNKERKAEIKLKHANEQLVEAKALVEQAEKAGGKSMGEAQVFMNDALKNFDEKTDEVKAVIVEIKQESEQENDLGKKRAIESRLDKLVDRLVDQQIKQTKVLERLEEKLQDKIPDHTLQNIVRTKERVIDHIGDVIDRVDENKDRIAERISRASEAQRGSEFKQIKQMEILERIRENRGDDDEFKAAIDMARADMMDRFEENIRRLSIEDRVERFARYMRHVGGGKQDSLRDMKIISEMKERGTLPPDIQHQMDNVKNQVARRIEKNLLRLDENERDKFFDPLKGGDFEDIKVMTELRNRIDPEIAEEIKKHEEDAVEKFKEKFIDDSDAVRRAERFRELASQMRENPTLETMQALQDLEVSLPPEQKEFIDKLKKENALGFEDKFEQGRDEFLDQMTTNDPRHIERLKELRRFLPPEAQADIDKAMSRQVDFVTNQLSRINDPIIFENFKRQLEENPDIRKEFEQRREDFSDRFDDQGEYIKSIRKRTEKDFDNSVETEKDIAEEQGIPFDPSIIEKQREFFEKNQERVYDDAKHRFEEDRRLMDEFGDSRQSDIPFENKKTPHLSADFSPERVPEHVFEESHRLDEEEGKFERDGSIRPQDYLDGNVEDSPPFDSTRANDRFDDNRDDRFSEKFGEEPLPFMRDNEERRFENGGNGPVRDSEHESQAIQQEIQRQLENNPRPPEDFEANSLPSDFGPPPGADFTSQSEGLVQGASAREPDLLDKLQVLDIFKYVYKWLGVRR